MHEPFGLLDSADRWMPTVFPHWFQYICSDNEDIYQQQIEEVVRMETALYADLIAVKHFKDAYLVGRKLFNGTRARLVNTPPLLKDPIAIFSAPWLACAFDLQVVVMIRHPAAFASSLKRLNWTFDFRNWRDQPLLLRDYLQPFEREIIDFSERPPDIIDQAILLWNAIYSVVSRLQKQYPSWLFLRHEDLASQPISIFRFLYRSLGLQWSPTIARQISGFSSEGNLRDVAPLDPGQIKRNSQAAARSWTWRLSPQEVERVRIGVAQVSPLFYSDAEWEWQAQVQKFSAA
jgi:hypothetical protein